MRPLPLLSATALLLCASLAAQGVVPPPVLRPLDRTPGLNPPGVPGSGPVQIHMVQLPGDPAHVYTVGMTFMSLPATSGGAGDYDLLTGKYDTHTDTFTPDMNAAGLNTPGREFNLMLSHDGLLCTWEVLTGTPAVFIGTRPNLTSPFTNAGAVTGLPAQTYYDPGLANIGGALHLVWVRGDDIVASPLNLANRSVGAARVIVSPRIFGSTAHSPTPIMTTTGELVGMYYHDVLGSDSDFYMAFDIDPNTEGILVWDTTSWLNNGSFAAGIGFMAQNAPSPYHVTDLRMFWWTGGRASIGTNMEVSAYMPPSATGLPTMTFFFLSRAFLANPIPIPGVTGELGIDASLLINVSLGLTTAASGVARTSIPVPNDVALRGAVIPAQAVGVDLNTNQVMLGNTAAITVNQ